MQVFILGMHRSGTSALARVLNLMGLYFGGEQVGTGRNLENQKGFWERRDVRTLNDTILFNANCDWDCVSAFRVDELPSERIDDYHAAVSDIVMDMDAHRPWFLKEPRFCLLFPVWRAVLEMPFCIHIHRNPLEVAHSLKDRNGVPIRVGLALWEQYNRLALQASAGLPRHIVSYADLLDNPTGTVQNIHAALLQHGGYELRVPATQELAAFLDHGLRHHRREVKSLRAVATSNQLELYGALNANGPLDQVAGVPLSKKTIDTLVNYEATVDIGQRAQLWRASNERRSDPNVKMQLAIANLELRHARSTGEQAEERLRVSETRAEATRQELEADRQGLTTKLAKRDAELRGLATELAKREERIRSSRQTTELAQAQRRDLAERLARRELELRDLATKLATRDETIRSSRQTTELAQAQRRDLAERLARRELELRDLATKLATRDETIRSSRQTTELAQAQRRDLAERLARRELELRDLATKLATRDETIRSSRQTTELAQAQRRDLAERLAGRELELRDLATKLATRDETIRSSRQTIRQAQRARRDMAAKLARRDMEVRELTTELAVRDVQLQTSHKTTELAQAERREFKARLSDREREVRELERAKGRLEQTRIAIEQERERLRERNTALHQQADVDARERSTLTRQRDRLEGERDALELQRDSLHQYRIDVLAEASAHRAQARKSLQSLDAQIALAKGQVVELDELASHLQHGIEACLHSRRWRLGSILLALNPTYFVRGQLHTIGARLQEAVSSRNATERASGKVAEKQHKLLDFGLAGYQPRVADDSVAADAARRLALSRMLFERCAELGRHRAEVAGLRTFADQLAGIVESLQASRRWRLGDFLLSLPRRLLGKGRPETAVDAMSALVAEYRSDKGALLGDLAPPVPVVDQSAPRERQPRPQDDPRAVERERLDDRAVEPAPSPRPALPPEADMHPPEADTHRPETDTHPPEADTHPPEADTHPPEADTHLPEAERRPSTIRRQPVAVHRGSVDIVVCVHNAIEDVRQCLASVLTRSTVDFHLIVVNDGSDAETTAWLRQFAANADADVELIETNGPLGYTCAANRGLAASKADHAVLLNSDTIVPRLWLENLLDCMLSSDDLGIVGPLSNAASYQSVPEVVDGGVWAINDLPPGYNVDEFAELVHRVSKRQFPRVEFVNGFCFMISRRVIEKVGLLDEVTFPRGYGEENDYCLRAQAEGFGLAIADQCFVYHGKSKSFGHAARLRLAKSGGDALREKHGDEKIREGGARLMNSTALRNIREAVKSRLQEVAELSADTATDPSMERVLFVLPVRGGSGGANSVIQEVMGMRALGVDAKVATHVKYLKDFERFYADLLAEEVYFVFFDSDQDLLDKASGFDVIVATLWSSPAQIAPVAVRFPEKLYVYYVQDYEPWFFPADPKSRAIATDSYTLIPDMVLMAKTDWICRTVRERHAREVYRVAPSLDHGVYYPPEGHEARPSNHVRVAAMIRPTTPRRAPLRTLRVLQDVAQRVDENVSMLLFGCEPQNLTTYVRRNAPDLRLDSSFENRGILPREGVADLLREADVFVDFSDYQAFGRTGLEAMACGCAVVLPAVGGIYEYAVDGDNCLVVDTASVDDMASAVTRLVQDSRLRTRLKERGLATAARFDVARASLSELSVFRLAGALKARERSADTAAYRRHENPITSSQVVVRVLVGTTSSRGTENGALTQRALLPLRHRALRNAVRVHEADAIEELDDPATGVCIVYDGTVRTTGEARQILERCLAIEADLVYGVARPMDFGNPGSEADAAAEFLVRNATRVVVPSEGLGAHLQTYAAKVFVVAPALDERLWLEDTVHGERTLGDDTDDDLRGVVYGLGEDPVDGMVRDALAQFSDTLTAEAMPCRPDGSSGRRAHVDHVKRLRAGNRWQIGLLPAREDTQDADLKFLALAALGCSVVCSSRGVHSSMARHGENAIVVDNTPAAWADGVRQLATDRDLRIAIRDQAKLDLETRHLLNRRAPTYLRAYLGDDPSLSTNSSERAARAPK